jgi:hypothetical protein
LLDSLTRGSAPPPGFDADRLQLAAVTLAVKRRREAAHAWPDLAAALGAQFRPLFDDFAARTPLPARGGPRADGRAFAQDLDRRGALPDAGRLEVLQVDLQQRRCHDGLVPRRGPALRLAFLRRSRQLVVGLRLPGFGTHVFAFPRRGSR